MNEDLEKALNSDLALLVLENHLIRRAGVLYRMGFSCISASQMAAIGEHILTNPTLQGAQKNVSEFLAHQLEKLLAQVERGGQPTSWASEPLTGGEQKTLGQTLSHWVEKEQFLQGEEMPKNLDRLAALQRFWSRFYGRYRYRAEMGHDMPLQCEQEE